MDSLGSETPSVEVQPRGIKLKHRWPIIVALVICLILISGFAVITTDWIPRFIAWNSAVSVNSQRDKIANSLKVVGVVIGEGDSVGCAQGIVGYTCDGSDYIDIGTNADLAQIKRPIINALQADGYVANDNIGETGFENFTQYPSAAIIGSVRWDNEVQSDTSLRHLPGASKYKYFITIGLGRTDAEGQSESETEIEGNANPQTLPRVAYPAMSARGYFYLFNHSTNAVSFWDTTEPWSYMTIPMCADFRIVDENNEPVQESQIPWSMPATFYMQVGCIAIMSVQMEDIAAAGGGVEFDKPAALADMGTEACSNAGPPLEDLSAVRVTESQDKLNYELGGILASRVLCPGFALYDQNGNQITAAQLTPDDYVTIYHFGNVATKAQISVNRTSANAPTTPISSWSTATSSVAKFSFKYPSTWRDGSNVDNGGAETDWVRSPDNFEIQFVSFAGSSEYGQQLFKANPSGICSNSNCLATNSAITFTVPGYGALSQDLITAGAGGGTINELMVRTSANSILIVSPGASGAYTTIQGNYEGRSQTQQTEMTPTQFSASASVQTAEQIIKTLSYQ